MGKFVYKVPEKPPEHKHDMPFYNYQLHTGDVWQCSCMQQFMATVREGTDSSHVQHTVEWRPMWPEEWIKS